MQNVRDVRDLRDEPTALRGNPPLKKSARSASLYKKLLRGFAESALDSAISQNRVDSAVAYNRSNGGGGFVFVKNFGIKLD